jgi:hypothetical protein
MNTERPSVVEPLEECLRVGGLQTAPSVLRSLKRILTTSEPPKASKKEKKSCDVRIQKKGCNTRTSQRVTQASTTLAQARLTAEF